MHVTANMQSWTPSIGIGSILAVAHGFGASMKFPTADMWGILWYQATEVALTIACPNRSRAAGYSN